MTETPREALARLRLEYEQALQGLKFQEQIGSKRDDLEEHIARLKKEIESGKFQLHQIRPDEQADRKRVTEEVRKAEELLRQVTGTKRELDTRLDEYELVSKEVLHHIREKMAEAILEAHPELKSGYDERKRSLEEAYALLDNISVISGSVDQVSEHLEVIYQVRKDVKKKGVLSYLFGKNPNFMITKSLHAIRDTAAEILPALQAFALLPESQGSRSRSMKEAHDLFCRLSEHTKGRWGWKKIDREILPFRETIHTVKDEMQKMREKLEVESGKLNAAIEEWVDKHS